VGEYLDVADILVVAAGIHREIDWSFTVDVSHDDGFEEYSVGISLR
jgi:hypothetical protein